MDFRQATRNPLLLLTIALSSILLVPALFMDGMFMDGLIYTCVGKNLAAGTGTFWDPQFSATYMISYHEQPPLLFGMEAIFFKLLGTSLYVERMYCLYMAVLCFLALRFTWTGIFTKESLEQKLLWVPVLFFFISPVTFWAYNNNVEEASMVVFALASAGFQLQGIRSSKSGYGWFVLGGFALIASSLCKGAQGLFPVIIPMTWFIFVRTISFRKAVVANLIVLFIPVLFYVALSFYEPAVNSYSSYFHDRIAATFNTAGTATTSSRFFILFELLLDILPALFVGVLLAISARRITTTYKKEAIFFLVIGLSGILPLMVTLEQRGFYLVTGLPFVAIAMALLTLDGAQILQQKIQNRLLAKRAVLGLAMLLFAGTGVATIALAGTPKRDADMLHDVALIGKHCGPDQIVSTNSSTWSNWSLQGYLMRYHTISVSKNHFFRKFYIAPKGDSVPTGYLIVELNTRVYNLYRCANAPAFKRGEGLVH